VLVDHGDQDQDIEGGPDVDDQDKSLTVKAYADPWLADRDFKPRARQPRQGLHGGRRPQSGC
jgi:hypothetical protein